MRASGRGEKPPFALDSPPRPVARCFSRRILVAWRRLFRVVAVNAIDPGAQSESAVGGTFSSSPRPKKSSFPSGVSRCAFSACQLVQKSQREDDGALTRSSCRSLARRCNCCVSMTSYHYQHQREQKRNFSCACEKYKRLVVNQYNDDLGRFDVYCPLVHPDLSR